MKMNQLGHTDIKVSALCLGSMTWGTQNSAEEAHEQLDRAVEAGINFVDTAEMYPVNPIKAKTIGRTERIIGLWNEDRKQREKIVIATKHSGEGLQIVRDGAPITPETIAMAVEGSLRRLKTDYIDLYQFHWPNRGSYMFRQNWRYNPDGSDVKSVIQNMEDCLGALDIEQKKGRIRAFGLSNESAWGTMQWLNAAARNGGMRAASVQNEYSLLCRLYDTDMAELSAYERIGLLSFSPLATGYLTGKYQSGAVPEGSRKSINPDMGGRASPRVNGAAQAYINVAEKFGLDPAQMALAWNMTRPFMCSTIFGATSIAQLNKAIGSVHLSLSNEVMDAIDAAHRAHPMPY
ncbi:MAG: aldo/keto reductase [Paracoccaceae bacterium]